MLKNHPKGLLVVFFSNMGERFGFYIMMPVPGMSLIITIVGLLTIAPGNVLFK